MREQLATARRLFLGAYPGAVAWVLAGCGWGVVIGAALEATFGQGADGLLDAAGETSLEAVTGALLGMVGGTLVLACGHVVTLAPTFALVGKVAGLLPCGRHHLGVRDRPNARLGALTGVVCGIISGTALLPFLGAGALLESIHGQPVPRTFVQGGTLFGILAGGIIGLVGLGRTTWQRLPEAWREEVRRVMGWERARPV